MGAWLRIATFQRERESERKILREREKLGRAHEKGPHGVRSGLGKV